MRVDRVEDAFEAVNQLKAPEIQNAEILIIGQLADQIPSTSNVSRQLSVNAKQSSDGWGHFFWEIITPGKLH